MNYGRDRSSWARNQSTKHSSFYMSLLSEVPGSTRDKVFYLACVFAIGVALFPTTPDVGATSRDKLIGTLHLSLAALLFLTFAYFSILLFTKTAPDKEPTPRKLQRNIVYLVCGYTILACIFLMVVVAIPPVKTLVERLTPIFWLESVAVVAFGVSWLTKGETILKDEET